MQQQEREQIIQQQQQERLQQQQHQQSPGQQVLYSKASSTHESGYFGNGRFFWNMNQPFIHTKSVDWPTHTASF